MAAVTEEQQIIQKLGDVPPPEERSLHPNWRFSEDFPRDAPDLQRALTLLQTYSGIPKDKVEEHVRRVRDKAYSVFPYPCIGRWRFLDLYLASIPEYPSILATVKAGGTFVDLGCCFGQMLRQLASDGAPHEHLVGIDLRPDFVRLGYDLFRDRDLFGASFVTGDLLAPVDGTDPFGKWVGRAHVIHAASVFHLFGWDDQVRLGIRVVGLFQPQGDAMLVGRQVGNRNPLPREEHEKQGLGNYRHNERTLQMLWDEIGERTGTEWLVEADMLDCKDCDWGVWVSKEIIHFVIRKEGG